jgi:hypothetical protein
MTFETGVDGDWNIFAGMTIIAIISIWFVQDIPDQFRPFAAMRTMTAAAVVRVAREIWVLLSH